MSDARKPSGEIEILPPAKPKRVRRDGWTARRRQHFLEAVGRQATMEEAARGVGMSMTSVRNLRARDAAFDHDLNVALATVRPSMVEAGYQRAVVGWEEPVFQGGKLVGTKRRYSDSVLRFMLDRKIDPTKPADDVFRKQALPGMTHVPQEELLAVLEKKIAAVEKIAAREKAAAAAAERAKAIAWADDMRARGLAP